MGADKCTKQGKIAVCQQPASQGHLKYALLVLQALRQVKSPRNSLRTPGLSKHHSVFKLIWQG